MTIQEKFTRYEELLREYQTRMNLVAPSTLTNIRGRHIDDSAQLADFLPAGTSVIDMGSGAGFPSVVLAVLGWNVTAIESIGKKAGFLDVLKRELDLPNFTVYHGRVEDYIKEMKNDSRHLVIPAKAGIKNSKLTGKSIVFTARAFAPLIKILDFVKPVKNSRLILLKGREIEAEIRTAKTKHKFEYKLTPSKTGDGLILDINF